MRKYIMKISSETSTALQICSTKYNLKTNYNPRNKTPKKLPQKAPHLYVKIKTKSDTSQVMT